MQYLANISQFEALMDQAAPQGSGMRNCAGYGHVTGVQTTTPTKKVTGILINNFRTVLFNLRKGMDKYGNPKRDDGYYDGTTLEWRAYDALPEIEPDDGWNMYRREYPSYFQECGMTTPDDGKNYIRNTPMGRYLLALEQFKDIITGREEEVMQGEDEDQIYRLWETLNEDWRGGEQLKEQGYNKFDIEKYQKYVDQWLSNWSDRRAEERNKLFERLDEIDAEAIQDMNDTDTIVYYLKRMKDPGVAEYMNGVPYDDFYKKRAQDLFETLDRNQRGEARKNSLVSTYFGHPYSEFLRWAQHALDGGFVSTSFVSYGLPPTTWSVEDCLECARDSFLEMSDEEQLRACTNHTELVEGFNALMGEYKKKREAERDIDADKEAFRNAVLKRGGPYKEFEVWGGRYERGSGYVEDLNRHYWDKKDCGAIAAELLRMMGESDYAKLRSDPLFLRIGQELAPDVWERVMGSDAGADVELPVVYDDTDSEAQLI